MDPYYKIDFDGIMKASASDGSLEKRSRVHRRISKSLTYDQHHHGNKSFVDIIRDRIFSPDAIDSPNPLNPSLRSPSNSPSKRISNSSSKKKINRNSDIRISRISSFFNLDDANDDIHPDPNIDDDQILNDVSLELKNLNTYCDYSTPTHVKLAPLRVQENALKKGISLASLLKQQLYYNPTNLSSSMKMSSSSPNISSRKRPSTADDSRRRYEARQKLKNSNINTNDDVKYDPVYYKLYDDLQHYDFLISIEHCSDCSKHISLRHDESKYESNAKKCVEILLNVLVESKINARVGVIRVTPPIINAVIMNKKDNNNDNTSSKKALKRPVSAPSTRSKSQKEGGSGNNSSNKVTNNEMGSRVGALEIQVVFKDAKGSLHTALIHSKLQSKTWPTKNKIADDFKSFIQYQKKAGIISSYANNLLGAYDFLLIDDNDSPKKDSLPVVETEPVKEQVQTCPMFETCTRCCRAITTDTANTIIETMPSAISSVNTLFWCCDTSAFAHIPDYSNGDYVAVEIRNVDKKKSIESTYVLGRVIASHRDGSYSIKYKQMLWGTQTDGYALLSSSVLDKEYMLDSHEDNNDNNGYVDIILRQHLQDMYIKKGKSDTRFHDEFVIRYINGDDVKCVYNNDTTTTTTTPTATTTSTNTPKITTSSSGYYDINNKVETFSSKYQNILNIHDDNTSSKKKKVINKTPIEEESYKFSFAQN